MSSPTNITVGTYTGDGSAKNIEIGFVPSYVRIVNITDVGVDEWFAGMTDATSYTNSTEAAAGAVRAAPGGVTPNEGSAGISAGFSVGAALSVNAKVYRYIAIQNGPGA